MWADATVADCSEAFLQLMNLLYCRQLNKEYKILLGLQVYMYMYFLIWKEEAGMQRLLVHGSRAR